MEAGAVSGMSGSPFEIVYPANIFYSTFIVRFSFVLFQKNIESGHDICTDWTLLFTLLYFSFLGRGLLMEADTFPTLQTMCFAHGFITMYRHKLFHGRRCKHLYKLHRTTLDLTDV